MSQKWVVRIAEPKDAETIARFNVAMAWETERKRLELPVVIEGVQAALNDPQHGFYVVAETAGGIAGCCMVTYEWSDWRCGVFWWIQSVYVKPEFRRQKVFSTLYEFLKQRASREPSVCGFRLYVEGANHTAQATYSQVGMAETSYKLFEELFDG